jgi:hypothetical protein
MEQTTLIIVVITNIILVIGLGGLGFLIYKLLKDQKTPPQAAQPTPPTPSAPAPSMDLPSYHPEILKRMQYLEEVKAKKAELACPNHPTEPGETICAICDLHYCQACVKPFKSMYLCKEHMPLVMGNEWSEVVTVKSSATDPEKGVRLYELKKELFREQDLPSYVETHYKLNLDQDSIETYLVMFAKVQDLVTAKQKMQEL